MIPGHVALSSESPRWRLWPSSCTDLFLEVTQLGELTTMSLVWNLNPTGSRCLARRREDSGGLSDLGRAAEEGEAELLGGQAFPPSELQNECGEHTPQICHFYQKDVFL